jgi:hypothetical protein
VRTVLVAILALALVPAASASTSPKPPAGFHFVFPHRIVLVPAQKHRQQSCAAEGRQRSNKRVSKPRPVACEQPPRVNLNGASGSITALLHL